MAYIKINKANMYWGQNLEMKDASYLPQLAQALKDAEFSEEDIEKIFYKNVLRVFKEVTK